MKFQKHRLFSFTILVLIIVHGIFRKWMLKFYYERIRKLLEFLGYTVSDIRDWFLDNGFLAQVQQWSDWKVGYFVYYPIYFTLHLAFIFLLFRKNKKIRKWLMITVSILVIGTRLLIVIANKYDWEIMASMGGRLFNNLLGLPFILLAVEGGKLLYQDMVKLVAQKNSQKENFEG